jgi:hypothetical protein
MRDLIENSETMQEKNGKDSGQILEHATGYIEIFVCADDVVIGANKKTELQ